MTVSYEIPSTKHPSALLDYVHDFTQDLLVDGEDVGDALIGDSHPDPLLRPTVVCVRGDATVASHSLAGNKLTYWVQGGIRNKKARFQLTVNTVQGRRIVVVTILNIDDD